MTETVFTSNKNHVYRIPALFYHSDEKVLLAFAEKRRTEDDAHSQALVMRRGTVKEDKTVTFEEPEIEMLKKADHGDRPMNPCPVFDRRSKTLFLFFIFVEGEVSEYRQIKHYENKARLCYVTSTDAGNSWSDVVHLSDQLREMKNWATFAVGPGHGLQTCDGTLIVPVHGYSCCSSWCYSKCCSPTPFALSLYSEDQGQTWRFGKKLQTNSGECEMAEFFNDGDESRIYCNARVAGACRVEAVSEDSGDEFKLLDSKLGETGSGCQGSVVSFPAQPEGQDQKPKWLLYTHPTDPGSRKDLGVYLNKTPNDSKAWSKPWIINPGPSGYSDLVYMGDGWFACLVECGEEKIHEKINLKVFSYSEVKQHVSE